MEELTEDNFRVGDYVLRIKGSHLGMEIGVIDVIESISINGLTLRSYKNKNAKGEGTHAPDNFVVVQMSFNFNKGE